MRLLSRIDLLVARRRNTGNAVSANQVDIFILKRSQPRGDLCDRRVSCLCGRLFSLFKLESQRLIECMAMHRESFDLRKTMIVSLRVWESLGRHKSELCIVQNSCLTPSQFPKNVRSS